MPLSDRQWRVAFGKHINTWVTVLLIFDFRPVWAHHISLIFLCPSVQARRARQEKMAKVCSENSFSARRRLSANDNELGVIENGESRSDVSIAGDFWETFGSLTDWNETSWLVLWGLVNIIIPLLLSSRVHSLCGDNCDRALRSESHRDSFTGAGAMAR